MLRTDEIMLLVLKGSEGKVNGKTLFQKKLFFVSLELKEDLGYKAHFYGPYSPDVNESINRSVALGFIQEIANGSKGISKEGFPVKRFDYILTGDGEKAADNLIKSYPKTSEKIFGCLKSLQAAGAADDYLELSIAAKTLHIQREINENLTPTEIIEAAKKFGWSISDQQVNRALDFLNNLKACEKSVG